MSGEPGGKGLGHFKLVGEKICDASDNIAEHDPDQRHHDNILKLDTLNKPDKTPCSGDSRSKGEQRPSPQCRIRHKQQCQQNSKLRGGNGCACGGRHEFIHAKLLHDKARHTHSDSGTQEGEQPRQS